MDKLIELLPLPEKSEIDRHLPTGVRVYGYTASDMKTYARACVAHATAAKDAEIEALRAEVKDYRTNGAAAVRFAPSSAHWSEDLRRLFGDDARTGIEVLESRHRQELARAERLAEALRIAEAALADIGDADREPGDDLAWCERRAAQALPAIRAALAMMPND